VFLVAAGLVLYVGLRATVAHQLVNWDGLSALAHAYDVAHKQPSFDLALIGFVEPPAPTLAYLPLAWLLPGLAQTGVAAAVFGAIFLGLSAVLVNTLGVRCGLQWWLRYPLVAAVFLHPVSLSYAALGSPLTLLLFSVLGMAKSLAAWGEHRHLRDLIGCSLYAALAVLTRYEAVFLVAAAALYIAVGCAMIPHDRYTRVEGTLITFLLPIAYFGGLWIGANWIIMGDPWHSLAAVFSFVGQPPEYWSTAVVLVPLLVCPICYALAYHELRPFGPWRGGAGAAILMAAAVAMPLVWPRPYLSHGNGPLYWSALAGLSTTVLATSLVLAMMVAAGYFTSSPSRSRVRGPVAGTVLLGVAGVVVLAMMRPIGGVLPAKTADVLRGYVAFAQSAKAEQQVAHLVASETARGAHVAIAGWPGFAIALYSGSTSAISVLPDVKPDRTVAERLQPGDLLVLLEGEDQWQRLLHGCSAEPAWAIGPWYGLKLVSSRQRTATSAP